MGRLGPVLGCLGAVLRSWEGHLGQSWPSWGHLGAVLGGLGPSWARFRPSWAVLGLNRADFKLNLGSILGKFCFQFGFIFRIRFEQVLGPVLSDCWGHFRVILEFNMWSKPGLRSKRGPKLFQKVVMFGTSLGTCF